MQPTPSGWSPPASTPLPAPAAPPATAPPRRRGRVVLTIVGLLAAFAVGLALGALLLGDDEGDDAAPPGGADRDASLACQEYPAIADGSLTDLLTGIDEPEIYRLQAISVLAQAAGNGARTYRALGEAGDRLYRSASYFDEEEFDAARADVRAECERLDLLPAASGD